MSQSNLCVFLDQPPGKVIHIVVSLIDIAKRQILIGRIFIPRSDCDDESSEYVQNIFQSASIVGVHNIVVNRILARKNSANFGYLI
jgi:hypothetical protein